MRSRPPATARVEAVWRRITDAVEQLGNETPEGTLH
jgi:hypothetical protein